MLKAIHRMGRNEKGFTLVELLIVIAIIAILAAVAIPQFTKYKANAAKSAAQGALASCGSELSAAYSDNSSVTTGTCTLPKGGGSQALTLDPTAGTLSGNYTGTISGVPVTCTWASNSVTCN